MSLIPKEEVEATLVKLLKDYEFKYLLVGTKLTREMLWHAFDRMKREEVSAFIDECENFPDDAKDPHYEVGPTTQLTKVFTDRFGNKTRQVVAAVDPGVRCGCSIETQGVWCINCGVDGAIAHKPSCTCPRNKSEDRAYALTRFTGEFFDNWRHRMSGGTPYTTAMNADDFIKHQLEQVRKKYPGAKVTSHVDKCGQVQANVLLPGKIDSVVIRGVRLSSECDCYDRACHDGHAQWCSIRGGK